MLLAGWCVRVCKRVEFNYTPSDTIFTLLRCQSLDWFWQKYTQLSNTQ